MELVFLEAPGPEWQEKSYCNGDQARTARAGVFWGYFCLFVFYFWGVLVGFCLGLVFWFWVFFFIFGGVLVGFCLGLVFLGFFYFSFCFLFSFVFSFFVGFLGGFFFVLGVLGGFLVFLGGEVLLF